MTTTNPLVDAGIITVGTKTSLSGNTDRIDRELQWGERVVLVIDAIVTKRGIEKSGNGPVEARGLTAVDLFELAGDRGRSVITALLAERRQSSDRSSTKEVLPGFDLVEIDGALVTPDEAKALLDGELLPKPADVAGFYDLVAETMGPLLDTDLDDAGVLDAIDALELTPRLIRAGYATEEAGQHRGAVLDYLDERLARQLVDFATREPWAGYAKASISAIVEKLMTEREALQLADRWVDTLEHVAAFEKANKARKGVEDFVAGETTELPAAPEPNPDGTGPDAGPDLGAQPDPAFAEASFEPTTDEPGDDDLELDDDEAGAE